MKEITYVNTGEVKLGNRNSILYSGAIGSCVVVCMYNSVKRTGAMAHIMLPGVAPDGQNGNTRYTSNAIIELIELMNVSQLERLETCIIGGANVLKRPKDNIGKNNIDSVEKVLDINGIRIIIKAIGGFERRTVEFNIGMGYIDYTEGDSDKKFLWKSSSEPE